ncbi:VWA domain-containing protein [Cytobacillus sp. IB215665]|uniref:VWA domain-containing protein n=1 Tax=Cytobacillus sp. IB215665 TaxID=3097357 RepID=UPI002A0AD4EF|nr:VWA domain-containing protein [Cytobacillus sp. IB215665]MDX8366230.1 VWA domain-containing protein [Cytobacillus sp. IB215665]
MGLELKYPLLLLLFIPAIMTIVFFAKDKTQLGKIEKVSVITLRSIIYTLLILALTVPTILYPINGVTTVFVVDRSASVGQQEIKMVGAVEDAVDKKEVEDRYGIVSVADNASVVRSISPKPLNTTQLPVMEKTNYTNLAEGIQLASSMLSNAGGRVVVLTDGNENVGDALQATKFAAQQGIEIDVMPFAPTTKTDVAIESLEVPSTLYVGEQAKLSIDIESNQDMNATLQITKNNEQIISEKIDVKQGRNSYSFSHIVDSTTLHSYKAEIIAEGDEVQQNNAAHAVATVKGTPTILIVEGNEGDGDNLANAINSASLNIEKIKPELLPTNIAALLQYDSIVFANVSATKVSQSQMEMIKTAVNDFGVGFIMTGGMESFGLGGYFKTPIEDILPVDMELKGKQEMPSLGMVIVLDRSGSMAGYKMDLAKEAAARTVELLRDKDTLGFIAFDDKPWQIVETAPLDDKQEVVDSIRSIQEGGGTAIFPALQQAYEQLTPLELKRKHIILLTDGQSATNADYNSLISDGLNDNITISTVAIGSDADRRLLESLAMEGNGRFYDVADASTIPSILSRETALTTRTYIEDNPFYPTPIAGTSVSQLFGEGIPKMNAYIATTEKGRAETVLTSEKGDPVLTRWKSGLGKTIAWTSDLKGEWAGAWPAWNEWPVMWNDLITWTLPTFQQDAYDVVQTTNGKEVVLTIESADTDLMPLESKLVDDRGSEVDAELRSIAPGKYEMSFAAEPGIHYLQLMKREGEEIKSTFNKAIVVPYSKEFEVKKENDPLLQDIVTVGNGKLLESPEQAFRELTNKNVKKQTIEELLLLLAFFLFILEIAIRRFGIQPFIAKVATMRSKQQHEAAVQNEKIEKTFGRLQEKKKVSTQRSHRVANKNMTKDGTVTKNVSNKPISAVKQKENKILKNNGDIKSNSKVDQTDDHEARLERLLKAKNKRRR